MKAVASLLLFGVSLLLGSIAIDNIVQAWMAADVIKLAHIIEAGQVTEKYANEENKLGSEYFLRFEHDNKLDSLAKSCVDELSRSILTVRLASLESILPSPAVGLREPQEQRSLIKGFPEKAMSGLFDTTQGSKSAETSLSKSFDTTEWDRRGILALRATAQRLFCAPTDGNAWFQLARLLEQFSSNRRGTDVASQFSYWLAPAEKWVIDQRFAFVSQRIEFGDSTLSAEFQEDLKRIVRMFPVGEIAGLYVKAGQTVRLAIAREVRRLPDNRQKQIISKVDQLGVTMF